MTLNYCDLSVVIPAFNEVGRLEKTLESIFRYFKNRKMSYEIIVVDDGSTDSTADLVNKIISSSNNLYLIKLGQNKGKGMAVKTGMLSAKGNIRLFMDADGSTAIEELDKLIPYISHGFDVVIGSRKITGASIEVKQGLLRELLGFMFRTLVSITIKTGILDTQNGFKLFTAKAAESIFQKLTITRWSFDVEVLTLASKFSFKLKETPVVWKNESNSKMNFVSMLAMLKDLFVIFRRSR
jgi:dolichyl-phosphate beta-glucosyltransferase